MRQILTENIFIIIMAISALVIAFLIVKSPKIIKRLYFIWFLGLTITVQATYNNLGKTKEIQSTTFVAADNLNKTITCKVQMLNDKYSWKLKSYEVVQMGGEDIDIKEYLNSPELIDELRHSELVFCIGNSSHEGLKEEEENRASLRGFNFSSWLKELIPNVQNKIHILDLGVNTAKKSESSNQRRLIIISLISSDRQVNIKQALQNGLIRNKILPFNIQDYSKFDIK